MSQSEQVNELFAALSKAQAVMGGAKKSGFNPHFKSKYADLASVWDAAREALSANGLCVVQTTDDMDGHALVVTTLGHSSGQWVSSRTAVPLAKKDAQGYGSAMTYARRYGLMSMVGIAPEDDDGNEAVRHEPARKPSPLELARERAGAAGQRHAPGNAEALKAYDACRTVENYEQFARDCKEGKWA